VISASVAIDAVGFLTTSYASEGKVEGKVERSEEKKARHPDRVEQKRVIPTE